MSQGILSLIAVMKIQRHKSNFTHGLGDTVHGVLHGVTPP